MAKAFVPKIEEVVGNGDGTFTLTILVVFSGSEVPTGTDISPINIILDGGDSPVNIRNKISDAILLEAQRLSYILTATNIILPDFQKGV